ncbi:hypothetical protein [Flavobacterium covae]
MKEKSTVEDIEKEMQVLWEEVDEKTNSIIEILKGVSYKKIKLIRESVERKLENAINHSKPVL